MALMKRIATEIAEGYIQTRIGATGSTQYSADGRHWFYSPTIAYEQHINELEELGFLEAGDYVEVLPDENGIFQ